MRHEGEVCHVTLPAETGTIREFNGTRDAFFTLVVRTLNPAHTRTCVEVSDCPPAVVRAERYNVRSFPLGKPRIVHDVAVVVQECRPSRVDNTYVGLSEPDIALQRKLTRPWLVDVRTTVGTLGAPLGAATASALDDPVAFSPVTVTLYN
jgi:hypothetical protein